MKNLVLLTISLFSIAWAHAQEQPHDEVINREYQKVSQHIAQQYRIPPELLKDTIDRIDYVVEFQVNRQGSIEEPKISRRSFDCKSCERELLRIIKTVPAVTGLSMDDERGKVRYALPVRIRFSN